MVRCTAAGPSVERSAPGRGAWICSPECFAIAVQHKSFTRAWKQEVGPEVLAALQIAFEAVITKMRESSAVTKG